MKKIRLTRRIITGLAILVGASGTITVANEINSIATDVNVKNVRANVIENDGHYYIRLIADRDVKNVVARITTEDKKEYLVKKDEIKAGEVVEYEIDLNAQMPTRKLPHTGIKKEIVKSVVTIGNHTFNINVRYEVEFDNSQQPMMQVLNNTSTNPTLDELVEKREVSAEQRVKETEEKVKQEAEAKEKQEAEAKEKQEAEAKEKQEAEAKVKQEAEVKAKQEAEAKAKQEAEAKEKQEAEVKQEAEAKAKQEAEAKAKAKQEAEAKAKQEAGKNGLPEVTAAELADPAMNGLTEHTKKMKVALAKKFGITNFSMFREGDDDGTGHGHNTGMSVDFMIPAGSTKGDELAEYLTKNMNESGVYYVIWKQRFYMPQFNIYGPANTWNLMPNRGGITANHFDHVHVSFAK